MLRLLLRVGCLPPPPFPLSLSPRIQTMCYGRMFARASVKSTMCVLPYVCVRVCHDAGVGCANKGGTILANYSRHLYRLRNDIGACTRTHATARIAGSPHGARRDADTYYQKCLRVRTHTSTVIHAHVAPFSLATIRVSSCHPACISTSLLFPSRPSRFQLKVKVLRSTDEGNASPNLDGGFSPRYT